MKGIVADARVKTHRQQQHPEETVAGPNPVDQRERCHHHAAGQQRIEQRHFRLVEWRQMARDEAEHRVAEHAGEGEQERGVGLRDARPDRHHDACEADDDGDAAPPADPLAEERAGEQGHGKGRQEADRGGLVEAQVAQGQEVERREPSSRNERKICTLSLLIFDSVGTAISPRAATMARNCARNRIQITCAAGSAENVPRYFAVVSRQAETSARRRTSTLWPAAAWTRLGRGRNSGAGLCVRGTAREWLG